jgi:peptidoglycan/xylan/chitin deacetylase (PgdA/CDA1 family)
LIPWSKVIILQIKKNLKYFLASPRITAAASKRVHYAVAVLMYHDLSENDDIDSWLRVSKRLFELQLKELSGNCNFIRPDDLFQRDNLYRERLNVLITFDDGFVNQYRLALPVLEKLQIPALFFLSTENIQTGDIFWFDRVITPIQVLKIASLDLTQVGLRKYEISAKDSTKRWDDIQVLLEDIKAKGNDTSYDVKRILAYFDEKFGDLLMTLLGDYRPLVEDEITAMRRSGLCYFGSHSHRHEILTYLSDEEIKNNLSKSKHYIETLLGERIDHFSYPNGNTDRRVSTLCRKHGFHYGYVTAQGLVTQNTDRMLIPRISVGGYDSVETVLCKINKQLIKTALSRSKHQK